MCATFSIGNTGGNQLEFEERFDYDLHFSDKDLNLIYDNFGEKYKINPEYIPVIEINGFGGVINLNIKEADEYLTNLITSCIDNESNIQVISFGLKDKIIYSLKRANILNFENNIIKVQYSSLSITMAPQLDNLLSEVL